MPQDRFTVRMLELAAAKLNLSCSVEPAFRHAGVIQNSEGKPFYFKLSALDCNTLGASRIAHDKDYTYFFLKRRGYYLPESRAFFSEHWCAVNNTTNNLAAACAYAESAGYPRIVKPNSKSQGVGVQKVHNEEQLEEALHRIFAIDDIALLQEVVPGLDYRLLVYKERLVAAYVRRPLSVIGDGKTTLEVLTEKTLTELSKKSRPHIRKEHLKESVYDHLRKEYDTLRLIPNKEEVVALLPNANLSMGGAAYNVTSELHSSYIELALSVTRDMGLTFAGIDIIAEDNISKPIGKYAIIEVNAMPGLEHFAALGQHEMNTVRCLYEEILSDFFKKK